ADHEPASGNLRFGRGAGDAVADDSRRGAEPDWLHIGEPGAAGLDDGGRLPRLSASVLSKLGRGPREPTSARLCAAARPQAEAHVARDADEGSVHQRTELPAGAA